MQSLSTLAQLDRRIGAHLDGVRVDANTSWALCESNFKFDDAGQVFVGALISLASGNPARTQKIIEIACANPQLIVGLVTALRWVPYAGVDAIIQTLSRSEVAEQRAVAVAAQAVHCVGGDWLQNALNDQSVLVQACACRTVGEVGRVDLLSEVQSLVQSKDEGVAFWSCWSATLLGDLSAVAALKRFATAPAYTDGALAVVLRRLSPQAAGEWLEELAQDEANVRLVMQGAGIIGDPVFVPGLISMMSVPEMARIAADSFCNITGANLVEDKLDAAPPPENEDAPVQADPDDDLPWPDPQRVLAWWGKNATRFNAGTRYLLGKIVTPEHLHWVLRHGNQKLRYGAALELAMLAPGTPLFDTRAPGFLQQQRLGG